MHLKFEGVKGYATYAAAQRRGEAVEARYGDATRWVVIALPNGRFTPMVVYNDQINVGCLIGELNVCVAN